MVKTMTKAPVAAPVVTTEKQSTPSATEDIALEGETSALIDMLAFTPFILSRRGKPNFNTFQQALNPNTFDLSEAKEAILKDLRGLKSPKARRLANWVDRSPDQEELQTRLMSINAATSGSNTSRA
jgi:hypothetical protein